MGIVELEDLIGDCQVTIIEHCFFNIISDFISLHVIKFFCLFLFFFPHYAYFTIASLIKRQKINKLLTSGLSNRLICSFPLPTLIMIPSSEWNQSYLFLRVQNYRERNQCWSLLFLGLIVSEQQ